VSEDIAGDVLDRAYDADETLTDETKRFIDRHITPGEKRTPAPSARRGAHTQKAGRRPPVRSAARACGYSRTRMKTSTALQVNAKINMIAKYSSMSPGPNFGNLARLQGNATIVASSLGSAPLETVTA
jgi:hypothetical protein